MSHAAAAPILPLHAWRLQRRLSEGLRRLQQAAGCEDPTCGAAGWHTICQRCQVQLEIRIGGLAGAAGIAGPMLTLLLLLDGLERAELEIGPPRGAA